MRNLLHNNDSSKAWATVNLAIKKLKATINNTDGEYTVGDWNKVKLMYVMGTNHGLVYFWLVEDSALTCKGDKLSGCSLIDVDSHILVKTHDLMDVDHFYSTMCHENFHFNHWHYNAYEDLSVESGARIAESAYRMTTYVRSGANNAMNPFMIDNFDAGVFNGWLYDEILEFRHASEETVHDELLDVLGLLVLGADVNMIHRYTFFQDRELLTKVLQSLDNRHFDAWQAKQHMRGRDHVSNAALKTAMSTLSGVIKNETSDF